MGGRGRRGRGLDTDTDHQLLAGAAQIWGGEPNLAPDICAPLTRFASSGTVGRKQAPLAEALHVLEHEMAHAYGIDDERETDCRGLQEVRRLLRAFGASAKIETRLTASAWEEYKEKERSLPDYWSPRCRDGGPWDERATGPWP